MINKKYLDKVLVNENSDEYLSELSMKTYNEKGEVITEWDETKGWLEFGEGEQNKFGAWRMTQIYHPYTEEELKQKQLEKEAAALAESRRQLTLNEVAAIFMKTQLNTVDIPDQTSLRMLAFYPTFEEIVGEKVKLGFKFVYDGVLYKTNQPDLLIQKHFTPRQGTESLYSRIDLEHTGAVYDPIPYGGNMALENGKYYTQDNVLYICTRDTINPVIYALKDLVGIYVEISNRD